jgi:Ca-activated chloride channel family protein
MMKSLTVDLKPAFGKVDFTKDTDNHLMLELTGGPAAKVKTRPPLDLIAVVDVSSSMRSAMKMENVKKSVQLMVNHLTPGDFLTVMQYSTDVRFVLPRTAIDSRTKQGVVLSIGAMNPGGMTNFSAALEAAMDLTRRAESDPKAIKRIIFFSDGCPSTGDMDPDHLIKLCGQCPPEWAVTAMAYGTAGDESRDAALMRSNFGMSGEVNLDLLDKMAHAGRGNFYYMSDATSAARAFASELGGLITTVARDIHVRVKPKTDFVEITGVVEDLDVTKRGRSLLIRIPDLMADETKFVTLATTCKQRDEPADSVVADIAVQYVDAADGEAQKISVAPLIRWVAPGEEDAVMHEDVLAQLTIMETIKAMEKAHDKVLAADFHGATAILDEAQLAYLRNLTVREEKFLGGLKATRKILENSRLWKSGRLQYEASLSEAKRGRASGGVWDSTLSTPTQEVLSASFIADADTAGDNGAEGPTNTPAEKPKRAKRPRKRKRADYIEG